MNEPAVPEPVREDGEHPLRAQEEMPVVARMVVEIRSDGVKTVARGAMEDLVTGQQVAIETQPLTPLELSLSLTKTLVSMPGLVAKSALQGLIPRLRRRLLGDDQGER